MGTESACTIDASVLATVTASVTLTDDLSVAANSTTMDVDGTKDTSLISAFATSDSLTEPTPPGDATGVVDKTFKEAKPNSNSVPEAKTKSTFRADGTTGALAYFSELETVGNCAELAVASIDIDVPAGTIEVHPGEDSSFPPMEGATTSPKLLNKPSLIAKVDTNVGKVTNFEDPGPVATVGQSDLSNPVPQELHSRERSSAPRTDSATSTEALDD